jgi:hypothetical protein
LDFFPTIGVYFQISHRSEIVSSNQPADGVRVLGEKNQLDSIGRFGINHGIGE